MKNLVSVSKTKGYEDVLPILSSSIEALSGLKLSDGDRVLIKPNLCNYRHPSSGAITHPKILDALLCFLRKNFDNLEIIVIESDATASRPDLTLKGFGFDEILEKWDAAWYNLSENPTVTKRIDGLYFKEIEISEIFDNYDFFISVPKLKTHLQTKLTACLKNQFGCLPYKNKVMYHKNINDVIADVNQVMRPDLCIVDAILSMAGGMAIYGIPVQSNLVITGKDPVSVDAVCARIFGYSPRRIAHIQKAKKIGVGTDSYSLVGDILSLRDVKIDTENPFGKKCLLNFGRYLQSRTSLK
jgi:uncharacterized protein (DUF362 family)